MEIEIVNGPGAAAAKIIMEAGETATAEAGAMIGMSGDMSITTTTHKKKSKQSFTLAVVSRCNLQHCSEVDGAFSTLRLLLQDRSSGEGLTLSLCCCRCDCCLR